jgi:hypothetical protein
MKIFLNLILALTLAGLPSSGSLSLAQQKQRAQDAQNFSNLTLEISSTKDEFLPLEPIPLVLVLSNATTKPVSGHKALDFSQNYVELFVDRFDGSASKIEIKNPLAKLVEVGAKVYQPGEAYSSKQLVTTGLGDALSKPGEYRLQAVVHGANWYEEVKSNFLTVRIVEAKGADKQALDYLKGQANVSELFAGFDLSEDQTALGMLEGLVSRFGNTAYGNYAAYRLGEFYFYRKDYAKANRHFGKLVERADFIFADKAKQYLEKIKKVSTVPGENPQN